VPVGKGLLGRVAKGSDGVLTFESAHLDNVVSEIAVPSDHVNIHRAPRTVLEVQRILFEHLDDVRREYPYWTGTRRAKLRTADGNAVRRYHDTAEHVLR